MFSHTIVHFFTLCFLSLQVNKKSFKLLVSYLEGLQGAQRSRLVEEANERVESYRPQQEGENEAVSRYQYKRAVELLRVLA